LQRSRGRPIKIIAFARLISDAVSIEPQALAEILYGPGNRLGLYFLAAPDLSYKVFIKHDFRFRVEEDAKQFEMSHAPPGNSVPVFQNPPSVNVQAEGSELISSRPLRKLDRESHKVLISL